MATETHVPRPARQGRHPRESHPGAHTTEFWTFLAVSALILLSAAIVGGSKDAADTFTARSAWLYVAILGSAYLISRGLAKAGVRDVGHAEDHASANGGMGERFRAAAAVLADGPEALREDRAGAPRDTAGPDTETRPIHGRTY